MAERESAGHSQDVQQRKTGVSWLIPPLLGSSWEAGLSPLALFLDSNLKIVRKIKRLSVKAVGETPFIHKLTKSSQHPPAPPVLLMCDSQFHSVYIIVSIFCYTLMLL